MPLALEERAHGAERVKTSLLSRGHSRLAIANQVPGMCVSPAHISRAIQGASNWPATWADTVRNSYVQICWAPQIQELIQFLLLYAIVVLRVLWSITYCHIRQKISDEETCLAWPPVSSFGEGMWDRGYIPILEMRTPWLTQVKWIAFISTAPSSEAWLSAHA